MKEHLLGQAQYECYTIPPSLYYGPGRLRGRLDPLSLAQSPFCSGL